MFRYRISVISRYKISKWHIPICDILVLIPERDIQVYMGTGIENHARYNEQNPTPLGKSLALRIVVKKLYTPPIEQKKEHETI